MICQLPIIWMMSICDPRPEIRWCWYGREFEKYEIGWISTGKTCAEDREIQTNSECVNLVKVKTKLVLINNCE